ncbi:MAG: Dihydrolipoyllysine-residue acetyltransferase component of pyruvate dehydrogenase complex [Chlamydiales bacterium]|nr:Dihydrolipoyllysine-residue acetyltransferase component of pyruvate dehydrogenase complex [Chlamydiales bacterium]MCH9703250.1 pyruvate dehydrogenase complex dihydrolipoamide acetyltransferase [Chlamydiota bacterium]
MNLLTMPKLSPTMEEGVIAKWHKSEGDFVAAGELLLEITTDKATVEHNALDEGYLREILVKEGDNAKMNAPIAVMTETKDEKYELPKEKKSEKKKPVAAAKVQEQESISVSGPKHEPVAPLADYTFEGQREGKQRVVASPLAKKLAKEKGLDLTTVKGTGPGGRITSEDLERAQPEGIVTFGRNEVPREVPGSFEEVKLTPMRKVIGKRLQESKMFIPHFYVTQKVNAQPMIDLRAQLKEHDLKITFNDLIIRATALALRKHPKVNAGYNSVNDTLIQFKTVDIAIAVAIEDGLITPIVRHADYKNLGEISLEVKHLAKKAQAGKLMETEYKGGSFCISNLGMYGITEFVAVINPPQAAILAIGGIEEEPVVENGHVVPGKRLTLTLSADHRVVDGADAAQFMKTIQHLLENPSGLLI